MVSPKWAAMTAPKGSMIAPGNDDRHNLTDPNRGGGPQGMNPNAKHIPARQRGGTGQNGKKPYVKASMGGGRGGSGNPASRGSTPGSFHAEKRVPGHGGSPQTSKVTIKRQFGKSGQQGVPTYPHSNPQAGRGNTGGKSYRMIAGHFKRAAMGAKATGGGGKYGSPPVTTNT